jgi:hypothetical protein
MENRHWRSQAAHRVQKLMLVALVAVVAMDLRNCQAVCPVERQVMQGTWAVDSEVRMHLLVSCDPADSRDSTGLLPCRRSSLSCSLGSCHTTVERGKLDEFPDKLWA